VVYTFKGSPNDGANPFAGLVATKGSLYGTTVYGGGTKSGSDYGTVFALSPVGGKDEVLHDFKGGKDGAFPYAGLVALSGKLYGTTSMGGSSNCSFGTSSGGGGCGTVFEISTVGAVKVLHKFTGFPSDGVNPHAGLLALNGTLYGTTLDGGDFKCGHSDSGGCGTVFEVSTSGKERVLYRFKGYPHDGAYPSASLVAENGILYGTTSGGGNGSGCSTGCGTIFEVTTSGAGYKTLYSFKGGTDGEDPQGALLAVKGALYGTTESGGATNNGTVFAVNASGTESVLYGFKGGSDGALPFAGLVAHKGAFYGTTTKGGVDCPPSGQCGTVFEVSTSGAEQVVHSFKGRKDGAYPVAALLTFHGALYGTTPGALSCGSSCQWSGTVFRVTP